MTTVCPLPLRWSDTYGQLTIGGWPLNGPAWCCTDLSPLRDSLDIRLTNVLVPGVAGRVPRSGLDDETDVSLRMVFSGACDQEGVPHADGRGGLLANRRTFEARYVHPIRTGAASLTGVLTDPAPDGGTVTSTSPVQPLGLLDWQTRPGGYAVGVLELRIPRGGFSEVDE